MKRAAKRADMYGRGVHTKSVCFTMYRRVNIPIVGISQKRQRRHLSQVNFIGADNSSAQSAELNAPISELIEHVGEIVGRFQNHPQP